ncbi:LOW QUALITY PROTEIN: UL16-binding protein 3-like [Muntiacus reevesi]|uniref:LOW QUALITY PROTEIN: UL16-binding protein 3-like n=1 Tax=Muntiacus reevesi TaxID=9886 RepID=UPI003307489A
MSWTADPGARLALAAHVLIGSLRFCIGEGNHNPLQYSCLENPRDGGTSWAAVYGVAQSRTRLKRLSSSRFCPARGDAHSLCYNFTVDPQPSPGEPWCVVQGQVDGNVFLSYDCGGAMIQSTSPLGEEVKTMNTWETQTETLRDIGDLFKWQLPNVILEKHMASGPLTLQARMTCQCEEDGHISGSWQFGFNGQMWLLFDSENEHWTVVHSGGRQMKEKWENDRAVTDFLKSVSMRHCRAWLQDFMVCWEEMLKSAASPTMGPPTVQPTDTAIYLTTGITAATWAFLSFFIIVVIIAWSLNKKRSLCSQKADDRCSVGLRNESLLGCFPSPAIILEPRDQTFGIPRLSTSHDDTVAAPSRVSCRI